MPSHTPITLTSSSRANSSGDSSRNGRASRITAALFTRPSSRPCAATASSTTRVQSSAWVTSWRRTAPSSSPVMSVAIDRRTLGGARLGDHRAQRAAGAGHEQHLARRAVRLPSAEHEAVVAVRGDLVAAVHVLRAARRRTGGRRAACPRCWRRCTRSCTTSAVNIVPLRDGRSTCSHHSSCASTSASARVYPWSTRWPMKSAIQPTWSSICGGYVASTPGLPGPTQMKRFG